MFNFTIGHGDGYSYAFLMVEDDNGNALSWNAIFMHTGKVDSYCEALPF